MRESVDQVLAAHQALGLEARRRWVGMAHGPCPSCGGKDRWHVGPDGSCGSVMGCRHCGDFRAIAGALGLGRPPNGAPDPAAMEQDARRIGHGVTLMQPDAHAAIIQPVAEKPGAINTSLRKGFPDVAAAGLYEGSSSLVPVWGAAGLQSAAVHRPRRHQAVPRPAGAWRAGTRCNRTVRPTRAPMARRGAGDRPVGAPRSRMHWACRTA